MNDSPPLIYGWTLVAVVLGPPALLAVVAFFVERQRQHRVRRGAITTAEREAIEVAVEYVGSAYAVEHHAKTIERLLERLG